ncbi:MAG: hypothetical protein JWN73_910 [Betaproteobacteria bacterium]|nr:hypothetical protein [Betaproteobacteria bacterium]
MQKHPTRGTGPATEPAADEAETEMGGDRGSETSEDSFKSNPQKSRTTGAGKPTARWKEAQDVEHEQGVPKERSRLQGGREADMPDNHGKPDNTGSAEGGG